MMRMTSLTRATRSVPTRSRHKLTARHNTAQRTRAFATTSRRQADDDRNKSPKPINLASFLDAQPKQPTNTQSRDPLGNSLFGGPIDTTPPQSQPAQNELFMDLLRGKSLAAQPSSRVSKTQPAPFKLGPRLGRTVYMDGGDLATAFRKLNSLCAANNVRNDERSQRFHERPGLKRKRLKSQRWRARFKTGFIEMVQRVQKMKKMGW